MGMEQTNDELVVNQLLVALSTSSSHDKEDRLLRVLGTGSGAVRLFCSRVNEEQLSTMCNRTLSDFWFIALRRYFPRELLRLYELQIFLNKCEYLIPRFGGSRERVTAPETWIDRCLREIYSEVLVQIDRTLFYTPTFIERHFKNMDWPGALDYFKYMILSVDDNDTFFNRKLVPDQDIELLNEMWRLSLGAYYDESPSTTYRRLGESPYLIGHLIDRASLFFLVVEIFEYLREEYKDEVYDPGVEQEIRELFGRITTRVSDNESHTVDNLLEDVPLAYREKVRPKVADVIDSYYGHWFDERDSPYWALFEYRGAISAYDGTDYEWIALFDNAQYRGRRQNKTAIDVEVKYMKKQESFVWLNMILYEAYIATSPPTVSRKKKSTDENSDSSESNKRRRVDDAVVLQQPDHTYVLSLLRGSGVLSIFHTAESTWKSYPVSRGDNIRLSSFAATASSIPEYRIAYDDIDINDYSDDDDQ